VSSAATLKIRDVEKEHPMKVELKLGLCAAAAILAGCGGLQSESNALPQAALATHSVPQWKADGAARPACPKARPGEARCLALIESSSAPGPLVAGWGPPSIQARYKLPSTKQGSGQIVATIDAYDNPNVATDLAVYRKEYGLGTAKFYKYNQEGQQSNYPSANAGWGVEGDLDAEMISASCPLCTIYLVEANSPEGSDLQAAEAEAVKLGAHIVSNSWICYGSLNCVDQKDFDAKGVEYLAAAGDDGQGQEGAPMAFDSVAAIGGTVLSGSGSGYEEMPWSGSGGGCITGVKKPKWQHDKVCTGRATNDAAALAWDLAEYDSYGYGGWFTVGGTSAASPLLGGVFGLAGNASQQDGGRTFWQKAHQKDLYDLCGSSCLFDTYQYSTGWGSPDGIGAF
jgi:hypothetical protein